MRMLTMKLLAPGLSAIMLAGVIVETMLRPQPGDAEPYHKLIRDKRDLMPMRIGQWEGTDEKVPEAAVALLKPNIILSRSYVNRSTNRTVGFLLVQCKDARDINGHYPPVCYPAHGQPMNRKLTAPRDWQVGGKTIRGMRYVFNTDDYPDGYVVDNFLILPPAMRVDDKGAEHLMPGEIVRDMSGIEQMVGDYLRRFYGGSQVQVVYSDKQMLPSERDEVFQLIIGAAMPLIETIRCGVEQP